MFLIFHQKQILEIEKVNKLVFIISLIIYLLVLDNRAVYVSTGHLTFYEI